MCSAIADIATCIPTGYAFFVLLDTQVQSLFRWSAVVHTSVTRTPNDQVDLPLSVVLGVQGLQMDEDLGEKFEFWTPTN